MIRTVLGAVAIAVTASLPAQAEEVVFAGLTLGAPLPPDLSPAASVPEDLSGMDPEVFDIIGAACVHTFDPRDFDPILNLSVVTKGCHGPAIVVVLHPNPTNFLDPNQSPPQATTTLDDLIWHETTLADIRAMLCSEGLVAPPTFGQQEAEALGLYSLAYEIEDTAFALAFSFASMTEPWTMPLDNPDAADRESAVLMSIAIAPLDLLLLEVGAPPTPSTGYTPLPPGFLNNTAIPECTLS